MRKTILSYIPGGLRLLCTALGFCAPAVLLSLGSSTPGSPAACVPLIVLLFTPLCALLRHRSLRGFCMLLLAAVGAAAAWLCLPWNGDPVGRWASAAYGALAPLMLASILRGDSAYALPAVGFGLTLLADVVAHVEGFEAAAPALNALCMGMLPLFFVCINANQLLDQLQQQRTARPRGILLSNLLMTLGLSMLVFVWANYQALWDFLRDAWQETLRLLAAFFSLFSGSETQIQTGASQASGEIGSLPAGETSPFWDAMEKVLLALALLAACVLCAWLLRELPALFRRLFARLRAMLRRYLDSLSGYTDDYVDETTALPAEKLRRQHAPRAPRHLEKLPPERQVRIVMGRICAMRRASSSETARETLRKLKHEPSLSEAFADSYDHARYSDHPVTEQEAKAARELLKAYPKKRL